MRLRVLVGTAPLFTALPLAQRIGSDGTYQAPGFRACYMPVGAPVQLAAAP